MPEKKLFSKFQFIFIDETHPAHPVQRNETNETIRCYCDIVFLVDQSGSMASTWQSVHSTINSVVQGITVGQGLNIALADMSLQWNLNSPETASNDAIIAAVQDFSNGFITSGDHWHNDMLHLARTQVLETSANRADAPDVVVIFGDGYEGDGEPEVTTVKATAVSKHQD